MVTSFCSYASQLSLKFGHRKIIHQNFVLPSHATPFGNEPQFENHCNTVIMHVCIMRVIQKHPFCIWKQDLILKTGTNLYVICFRRRDVRLYRGVRVPLISWFPCFWKFPCAKISAFSFIFSLFLAFLPSFTLFFLIFCLWPHTSVYSKYICVCLMISYVLLN